VLRGVLIGPSRPGYPLPDMPMAMPVDHPPAEQPDGQARRRSAV